MIDDPIVIDSINKDNDEDLETILVVEDIPVEGLRLRDFLIKQGFRAIHASGIHQAASILEEQKVDAMLADVHLGSSTIANTIVNELRKSQPWSFVMCFSGLQTTSHIVEARKICDIFMEKPLDFSTLPKIIREGISGKHTLIAEYINAHKKVEDRILPKDSLRNLNHKAYIHDKEELVRKYPGQYVAYIDGHRITISQDKDSLFRTVVEKTKRTDFFYKQIVSEEKIRKFTGHRKLK